MQGGNTAEIRAANGRVGALSRRRPTDDPELVAERATLRELTLAAYIKRAVDAAPPLSADQRARLAELLKPVRKGAAK